MEINLWFFLTLSSGFGILLVIVAIVTSHKATMKKLEIERLNAEKIAQQAANENHADLLERITTLEKIVTDKHYDLGAKIENLK